MYCERVYGYYMGNIWTTWGNILKIIWIEYRLYVDSIHDNTYDNICDKSLIGTFSTKSL